MKRRTINVFGLSFLDVMFCGFGSVILLVMIVNSNMIKYREQATLELKMEAEQVENELITQQNIIAELKFSEAKTRQDIKKARTSSDQILKLISEKRQQLGQMNQETRASKGEIEKLQRDLKILEEQKRALLTQINKQKRYSGGQVLRVKGEGTRQYLTGLRMDGRRILILVDRSASMLDETIVNIILKRNQSTTVRRNAAKWKRARATVEWLLSQLSTKAAYQVVIFNQTSRFLLPDSQGWLKATDSQKMDQVVKALNQIVPEKGTSLFHAFQAIRRINPVPDNVFLISDGLPTQGKSESSNTRISGIERLDLFSDAVQVIPRGIPVNIILLPMEGDPMAASEFWRLAVKTKGAFVSPSIDWP